MGCEDPAGEGQRGWEGAPAAAEEEEPCRLVLSTPSSILRDREIEELGPQLPPRLTQQPWHLLYSTGRDGFSLRTLYRSGARPDSPALLLIRDTEAQAFGAFSATAIRSSSGFYGTGETFLFSFCPELKVFRWTGRNDFFVKGDVNLLMVGGGRHGGRPGPAACPVSCPFWGTESEDRRSLAAREVAWEVPQPWRRQVAADRALGTFAAEGLGCGWTGTCTTGAASPARLSTTRPYHTGRSSASRIWKCGVWPDPDKDTQVKGAGEEILWTDVSSTAAP
ncbi:TLD domain-containing protein 2 isoform X1 [Haemorhous mexicanus]|uniref:TLD domain-containing protein 2 isoform X1 n=1 Tax=Haemorhous mexicanus TaxID=30427 RepID=UPI0028BDE06A|nr:TLD domain-containing protein 2 isoform X1 [Haemorhous mexicanus]